MKYYLWIIFPREEMREMKEMREMREMREMKKMRGIIAPQNSQGSQRTIPDVWFRWCFWLGCEVHGSGKGNKPSVLSVNSVVPFCSAILFSKKPVLPTACPVEAKRRRGAFSRFIPVCFT
jgi:hypothetical protein